MKVIETIMDKYFTNKYKKYIEFIIMYYDLDYKFKRKDGKTIFCIKKRKYKDYTEVYSFYDTDTFQFLIEQEGTKRIIQHFIEIYLGNEE